MAENELGKGNRIVALVRDLMFASRVRGAAPEAVVGQSATVLDAVGPDTRIVFVELEAAGAEEVVVGALDRGAGRVVAFAPHIHEEALAAARESGAEVLSRGAFVKRLPELVRTARSESGGRAPD